MTQPRQRILRLLVAGLSVLVADLTARVSLSVVEGTRNTAYQPVVNHLGTAAASRVRVFAAGREFMIPDPELGWSPRPGAVM